MLLTVQTMSVEEVDISVTEVSADDKEEEVEKVEESTANKFADGELAHMKMESIHQISPVPLNIQSGPHPHTIQGRTSLTTQCAQSFWRIKLGAPPALAVLRRIMRIK